MLVLQATNAGTRRPGYEARWFTGCSKQVSRVTVVTHPLATIRIVPSKIQVLNIATLHTSIPLNITVYKGVVLVCSVKVGQPSGGVRCYGEPAHPGKVDALITL